MSLPWLKNLIRWQPFGWVARVCHRFKVRCCNCREITARMRARAISEGRSGEGCGAGCDLCYTSRPRNVVSGLNQE